jgi:hypothetical protein
MAHERHAITTLGEVAHALSIGNKVEGTVLKSVSEGVLQVLLQDMATLGRIKIAQGVDPEDATAMADHTTLMARVAAIETILQADDATLDEIQEIINFVKNNAADITTLSTNLNAAIAAVQADVDQNEVDSDAAELALQNRATALEAFQASFDAAFSLVNDNGLLDVVVENDLNVNGNIQSNGTQIFNSTTKALKNVSALDAGTDAVVSATGKAYTDAHAAAVKVRHKSITHSDAGGAAFSTQIDSGLYVSVLQVRVTAGFDAGATLDIGHAGDAGHFGSLDAGQLGSVGTFEIPVYRLLTQDLQPRFTLSGAPTVGAVDFALIVAK